MDAGAGAEASLRGMLGMYLALVGSIAVTLALSLLLPPRYTAQASVVVDVKSTGLFQTDPVLKENGAKTTYWKTGHSYIKRYSHETGALVGFEKSGHFFFNPPIGRGYDDGLVAAIAVLDMLDRNPDKTLSQLKDALPRTWLTPSTPHTAQSRSAHWCSKSMPDPAMRRYRRRPWGIAATAGPAPILIRVETQTSHGYRPTDKRIAELADIWAFTAAQMGMGVGETQTK